jgi:ethanolamine utilization protein EutQ
MDKLQLETLVRQVLMEKLGNLPGHGVRAVAVPQLRVTEADRMDTGRPGDVVYTHDLFTLEQSPRLGAGLMEMHRTTFPWTLNYDEMDYVIEGRLEVLIGGDRVSAGPGEVLYIPKGSAIEFSAPEFARFLYFVYPADWQNQKT